MAVQNSISPKPAEVFPGIFLIDLPLPSILGRVNVFLIRTADGYVLFDTGMNYAPCREAMEVALEQLGVAWGDIHTIFISHFHPDHVGLAGFTAEKTGARLLMHQADYAQLLEYTNDARAPAWATACLDSAGCPAVVRGAMDQDAALLFQSAAVMPQVKFIADGAEIASANGPLEVVWTPGHSAGHLCLYSREHQVLISGDHILDGITPNIHYHPDLDPLGDFLASLDKTAAMPVRLLIPSHGVPFVDHVTWIERVKNHHRMRCDRILAALADESLSCYSLSQHLWKRPLTPFHLRFALFELLAHLEYLRRQELVRHEQRDGVLVWI